MKFDFKKISLSSLLQEGFVKDSRWALYLGIIIIGFLAYLNLPTLNIDLSKIKADERAVWLQGTKKISKHKKAEVVKEIASSSALIYEG